MNRLGNEKSPYLRHAAAQPVDWYAWGEEAFRAAEQEDKAVFLSSGAAWCHWCHVMARECFEDREVAALLNDRFISIKLDRDERPDIDRRFQQVAAAAGVGGGWPLNLFLTPDKKPFFVGTYFPPEDAHGRPGFKRILRTIAGLYRTKRDDVDAYAGKLAAALKREPIQAGTLGRALLDEGAGRMLSQFDSTNGGFGTAPKFPMPGALEFLMQRYAITGNGVIANAVRKTLEAMAKGGFQDQLGGGFHRYSTDESWSVPHFEKMADDNAWLLRNYTDGYGLFRDARFRDAALGIVRFANEVLADPEGGFYASQDADVTPDDEGGYFTWTEEEIEKTLTPEEYRVLSLHFLDERGITHHDPSKRVLLVALEPDRIAVRLGMAPSSVTGFILSGRAKLLQARRKRPTPLVDRTLYTSLNGMFITAFLRAFRVFRDEGMLTFALKSLSRIAKERAGGGRLSHSEGVKAFLDDYAALTEAAIEAFEATGETSYLELADRLMGETIDRFWDKEGAAFFDAEEEVLSVRLKGFEDIPQPSGNSMAIIDLIKLSIILGNEAYRSRAASALETLSAGAARAGVHGGSFFAALDAFHNMLSLTFEGRNEPLFEAGLAFVKPFTAVSYKTGDGRVVPCFGSVCYEPIYKAPDLESFLKERLFLKGGA